MRLPGHRWRRSGCRALTYCTTTSENVHTIGKALVEAAAMPVCATGHHHVRRSVPAESASDLPSLPSGFNP